MNIIKRDGSETIFNKEKIVNAIYKANKEAISSDKLDNTQINQIASDIEQWCISLNRAVSVEEVQDEVEQQLYAYQKFDLMKKYMLYRYKRSLARSSTNDKILTMLEDTNEEINQENANKNPVLNSTKRDYIAGEKCKEICENYIFPSDLWEAHKSGKIHIHDTDYISMRMHNCALINLDDMFQNETVISGTKIETPKSFYTACNIATQIIAQVASSQYGGQTINIYHLSKFVDVSRRKIRKELLSEFPENTPEETINNITEKRLIREIESGIQTIQYQILTLMTTNGQTPFCSLFAWLNEAETSELKRDHAMVIKALLEQRMLGVKNEAGVYIAPSFPKILYVLSENNVTPDSEYYWLTELAAKCTAKRMVPDYLSEKKMRELKGDNVFGVMGCRSALSVWIDPETNKPKFWGRLTA